MFGWLFGRKKKEDKKPTQGIRSTSQPSDSSDPWPAFMTFLGDSGSSNDSGDCGGGGDCGGCGE